MTERQRHRIGVIPGDGIGPEVVAEALAVADAAGAELELIHYDLGGDRYLKTGEVLPDSVVEEWNSLDAILLGAVGHPEVAPGILERGLLLKARFELDLYVNLRPVKLIPGAPTPLRDSGPDEIDMVVVRENTEGIYAGAGGVLRQGTPNEVATQESLNTRMGAERCIRYAFGVASRRRKHLTMVHKTNVLTHAGGLWMRTFEEVGEEFPDVERAYNHVDATCLYLVDSPQRYDVIVTENLFGDIVTDLGAAIAGNLGFAASGNINPERDAPSIFEPVHGSAPDIAGKGLANPIATVLSAAMMFDFLGDTSVGDAMERAVAEALPDLGIDPTGAMSKSTSEAGRLIAAKAAEIVTGGAQ
ncbi:MAG: 3-isopropylmalate dehydrogenase [Acidobacteria bacterium]|nr:MAG: 3-isopropylmalate dehydrogenase [Acidobacteriota bacterium]